jgi:hypothetical protein
MCAPIGAHKGIIIGPIGDPFAPPKAVCVLHHRAANIHGVHILVPPHFRLDLRPATTHATACWVFEWTQVLLPFLFSKIEFLNSIHKNVISSRTSLGCRGTNTPRR